MSVNVALLGAENLVVTPGQSTTCQLSVANASTIVEQFTMLVLGEAMDWTVAEPPVVSLFPGGQQTVTLRFSPPRLSTTPSGEVPFAVKIIPSLEPEESVTEEGVVTVGSFNDVAAELVPRVTTGRITGRQKLAVDSRGNVPLPVEISAVDSADALKFKMRPSRLTAAPGEARFIRLRVEPRQRFWKGPQQQKPYKVAVAPEHEDPIVLDGALTQKAVVPKWAWTAALIAAILALLWFFVLKPVVHSTAVNANKQALAEQAAQTKALQGQLAATQSTVAANSATNAANAAAVAALAKKLHVTTTTTTTTAPGTATTVGKAVVVKPAPATPSATTTTPTPTTIATTTPTTTPATATFSQPPPVTGPNDGTIVVTALPGQSNETNFYQVPSQGTLQVQDLIIQNVEQSAGRAAVERQAAGTGKIQTLLVQNLVSNANANADPNQEYTFSSPMVFSSQQKLILAVDCPDEESACEVMLYYTGPLTQPQSDTTTTFP